MGKVLRVLKRGPDGAPWGSGEQEEAQLPLPGLDHGSPTRGSRCALLGQFSGTVSHSR